MRISGKQHRNCVYEIGSTPPEQRTTVFTADYTIGSASDPEVIEHGRRSSRRKIYTPGIDAVQIFDTHADGARKNKFGDLTSEETTYAPEVVGATLLPRFGMLKPQWKKIIRYNGGLHHELTHTHDIQLSNPNDVFTTTSVTDTTVVDGDTQHPWVDSFNGSTNKWTSTSPLGSVVERTIDSRERATTVHWPGTVPVALSDVSIAYDSTTGRVTTMGQGSRTYSVYYDGSTGFVSSIVDNALGRTWSYMGGSNNDSRDVLGRPLQQTLPGNRKVLMTWDGVDNMLSLTPPDNSVCSGTTCKHTFAPGVTDLLSTYTPPNLGFNGLTNYTYDRDSLGTAVATPSDTVLYTYDPQGRVVQRSTSFGSVTYAYESSSGLLSSVAAGGPTIAYTYLQGQTPGTLPTKVTYSGFPKNNSPYTTSHWFDYGYDGRFRVTSRKFDGASDVNYFYDADGAIERVTMPNGATFKVNRATGSTGTGLITSTEFQTNGTTYVRQDFTYNSFGEVMTLTDTEYGSVYYGLTYTRDAGGRIATKTETSPWVSAENYAYTYYPGSDTQGRAGFLQTATLNGGSPTTYNYDSHGNRTSPFNPQYDIQDRMTTDGWYQLGYTNNGELATFVDPYSSVSIQYAYDVMGNLRSIAQSGWSGAASYSYTIDGFDRRVARRKNGLLTNVYLYDDQNRIIAELDPNTGALLSQFVYVTHAHVPDLVIRGGAAFVFVHDQLGSPMLAIDQFGSFYQHRAYDAFGNMIVDQSWYGFTQPFGFAGGVYDDQVGYRFGARDYNAYWAHWNSKDETRFAGGLNLFGYCDSDPVNCHDVTGNGPVGEGIGFIAGGVLGGVVGWNMGVATGFVIGIPTGPGEAVMIPAGGILGAATLATLGAAAGSRVGNDIEDGLKELFASPDEAHRSGKRPSTKEKHQKGERRHDMDKGGEKGDKNRRPPRQRPKGHKGPYPGLLMGGPNESDCDD